MSCARVDFSNLVELAGWLAGSYLRVEFHFHIGRSTETNPSRKLYNKEWMFTWRNWQPALLSFEPHLVLFLFSFVSLTWTALFTFCGCSFAARVWPQKSKEGRARARDRDLRAWLF